MIGLLAIKMFLGGALGRVRKAAGSVLGIIGRYPWQSAFIASLALAGAFWHGGNVARGERDTARAETASLIMAQKQAEAAQKAANIANVRTQIERNKGITNAHAINQTAVANAVADYKRLHPASAACSSRRATAIGVHPDTQAPAGPGDLAGLLTITSDNFDRTTTAAVRGAECTGFLNTLVSEGLAVGVD